MLRARNYFFFVNKPGFKFCFREISYFVIAPKQLRKRRNRKRNNIRRDGDGRLATTRSGSGGHAAFVLLLPRAGPFQATWFFLPPTHSHPSPLPEESYLQPAGFPAGGTELESLAHLYGYKIHYNKEEHDPKVLPHALQSSLVPAIQISRRCSCVYGVCAASVPDGHPALGEGGD